MYAVQGFQKIKMCEMIRSVKYVFNFVGKKTLTRSYTGTSPVLPSPKLTQHMKMVGIPVSFLGPGLFSGANLLVSGRDQQPCVNRGNGAVSWRLNP